MRILRTLIVLGAAAASAVAQTNGPVREVRPLSLQDCVRLALQNNLQIRSDRYNPLVALYTLQGSFGAYDPTLFLSGEHDHNEAGPGLLGNGLVLPGSTTDSDIFRGSLGGLLPWGTTYSLNGGATDNQGTTPSAVDNPAQPILFTNSFVDINSGNTISYVTTNYAQMGVQRPFNSSSASATVSATQPLLRNFWIDSSRLVIRVNRNKLKQSEMDLKWQVMQTITTLEQAYYDLIYYRE
jgi:outer membrane protein TolC